MGKIEAIVWRNIASVIASAVGKTVNCRQPSLIARHTENAVNYVISNWFIHFLFQVKWRLLEHVRPIDYDLYLHPNLETGLFTGQVDISLNITKETREIYLHSHLLTIESVRFSNAQGHAVEVRQSYFPPQSFPISKMKYPNFRSHLNC